MGWGQVPRRKKYLGGLIKLYINPLRMWRSRHKDCTETLKDGASVTLDGGPVSINSRTRRIRTSLPFGIFHLGRKR